MKQATIVHLLMLKLQRIRENIYVLQEAIVLKEVAHLLPALQELIPQVSELLLPPIVLLALQDKFAAEVAHNLVQLFATLGTIVQWELKIALWLSMYVTWDMSAPLDRLIKQNANLDFINQPKVKVPALFVQQ